MMSSNRPGSSRAKTNINSLPPRSRSVASKAPEEITPKPPTKALQSSKNGPEPETNIRVVIRCRRRSKREIDDNSPSIVSAETKSGQVSIETTAPTSTLGIVTLPPVRTYPFDLVFGPEADQASIYHEVVSPMLEQVVLGYNCTLFAYGQTGTGKTYTMQGDLVPTPMGNPSVNAGMIPRVLFRLFHYLETSTADYSVKVSYIELYNEELRDLLATEESKDGLKIFDEANKRGVFVQGIEEMSVRDSADALALLTKGSEKRQIAATKFNDHSSRSHSIFSITVHVKEAGPAGDDLLKIGKLNLVDLAGSENIGRSGAENKRAREAGMINQSLLTLGRVINALVDKAQHVPYRESKLTRLLQDSLGGRTKTCIIATISPARSNMEETLSTLDYALRAKSIRNKPELNQRMTRNSLLKEYVAEIERLKSDLLAAREKNGIFFSEDTWKQMENEQELRQTEMLEAKKQIEIVESQMRTVREEFEQSIGLLIKRDADLKETKNKLSETEHILEEKQQELTATKQNWQEEIVVRVAFQKSEKTLDKVAKGLSIVAREGIKDVSGLFDKLERKTDILSSNSKAVIAHGKTISSVTQALSTATKDLVSSTSAGTQHLQTAVKHFETTALQAIGSQSTRIEQQLQRIQDAVGVLQTQNNAETAALSTVWDSLKETRSTIKNEAVIWGTKLQASCDQVFKELSQASDPAFSNAEKAVKGISNLLESSLQEAQEYLENDRQTVIQVQRLASDATAAEISHLRQQNAALTRMLEDEQTKSDQAKDELIQRVSGLLAGFASEKDRRLREAVGELQANNIKSEAKLTSFSKSHTDLTESVQVQSAELTTTMEKKSGDLKRTRDGTLKSLDGAKLSMDSGVGKVRGDLTGAVKAYSGNMQAQMKALHDSCSEAFEKHSTAKRARIEATQSLVVDSQSQLESLGRGIASTSQKIQTFSASMLSESSQTATSLGQYRGVAELHLTSLHNEAATLLQQGAKEDAPTGRTPRKRVWNYVDQWELVNGRDSVLNGSKSGPVNTPPLPAVQTDLDDAMDEDILSPGSEAASEAPVPSSLASSSTSTVSMLPKKVVNSQPIIPFNDAQNVYTTRPRRRR